MKIQFFAIGILIAGSAAARDFDTPAPSKSRPHETRSSARTFDFSAPVQRAVPEPKENQDGSNSDPNAFVQPEVPPLGNDTDELEFVPGTAASFNSNDRAATPPDPEEPFPQMPPMNLGGGNKGGGQPPQPPSFQTPPQFSPMAMPTPGADQNLSGLFSNMTGQLGKTFNGDMLTSIADSAGKQLSELQNTFQQMMQTQQNNVAQQLAAANARNGMNFAQPAQGLQGQVYNTAPRGTASLQSRGNSSQGGFVPRAQPNNQLSSVDSASRSGRTNSRVSGGGRGPLAR